MERFLELYRSVFMVSQAGNHLLTVQFSERNQSRRIEWIVTIRLFRKKTPQKTLTQRRPRSPAQKRNLLVKSSLFIAYLSESRSRVPVARVNQRKDEPPKQNHGSIRRKAPSLLRGPLPEKPHQNGNRHQCTEEAIDCYPLPPSEVPAYNNRGHEQDRNDPPRLVLKHRKRRINCYTDRELHPPKQIRELHLHPVNKINARREQLMYKLRAAVV